MKTKNMILIALFAAVTSVLAYVYIPIPVSPVPVTGQTMGMMLAGAMLGPKAGFLSQVIYILLGAVGLPVFAGGMGGIGVLLGPRGGYLWAAPLAAAIVGVMARWAQNQSGYRYWFLLLGGLVFGGMIVIYAFGVLQLALVTQIPMQAAVLEGMVPFIIGDVAKVAASAFIVRSTQAVLGMEPLSPRG